MTDALLSAPGQLILVGNETNLESAPLDAITRRSRDLAGTLHQDLAARCDQIILTVTSLPLTVTGGAA
ncbi:hypothetical protein CCR95_03580 [Thiocystis minor]|uniref:bifunctional adenosylcobinamide kinase/adenosylcobinamide-phosphate guanylyltransferase n=1 Tax=Thiocystis minor TaxID=61597 RepID=UPI001914C074|nr:bifunctional adenosylcobinamide kinase/adenosylcobinamide-phosphate guanylyltransferase [Thiocystis minor]MBK5963192.1 hypothetical protein [Thiocystis minor]